MVFILTFFIALITILLYWFKKTHNYWQHRNVETVSFKESFSKDRPHIALIIQKVYQKMKQDSIPFIGMYNLLTPTLVIRDLDLLKNILINDFDTFPDRDLYNNPHNDPLSLNLVRLKGDKWRKIRQKLTTTFTPGKMKTMFPAVKKIGDHFVQTMGQNMELNNSVVEVRDLCARFTTDVIGTVAFGLDCNSLEEPQTEFRIQGDKAAQFSMHPLMDALTSKYTKFFNKLGYKTFPTKLTKFYSDIVRLNVKYREENNIKRNDFLNMLIDLKNNKEDAKDFRLEMEDVIAQAFVFFVAGFDSSSSTMSYALYELAYNPEIQEKARQNVKEILEKHQGLFTYESLNDMLYLKQVVQETLRKIPTVPGTRRVCRSSYTLPGSPSVTIDPGVQIFVPIYAIHHDPDYYPEPEKFLPERFELSAKNQRHPMCYLPFSAGPRACVAERFGLMQAMIGVALMLKNFKFSVCEKTPKELNFDPNSTRVLVVKNGIHLKVEHCAD